MTTEGLNRTALYDLHVEAGAKMVDFAGWEMPVQYTGIIDEHRKVRESAGAFDISHMGRLFVHGPDAGRFLQRLATNDVLALTPGQVLYTLICNREGGVRDDVLISRIGEQEYLVVPNASNRAKIVGWIDELKNEFSTDAGDFTLDDRTMDTVMVAIQGPRAQELLQTHTEVSLSELRFFRIARGKTAGEDALVSRTGYTGEDGFEVILPRDAGVTLWRDLMRARVSGALALAGLGARDTLRLEAGLPLYGHELSETVNPLEAGLKRFVRLNSPDFVGGEVLARIASAGPARTLLGLEVADGAIARQGTSVVFDAREVGVVSSGTFSPTLSRSIAMAFVDAEVAASRPPFSVVVRGTAHQSNVVDLPFFRRRKGK